MLQLDGVKLQQLLLLQRPIPYFVHKNLKLTSNCSYQIQISCAVKNIHLTCSGRTKQQYNLIYMIYLIYLKKSNQSINQINMTPPIIHYNCQQHNVKIQEMSSPSTQEGLLRVVPATFPGKQEHLTVCERSSMRFLLQHRWAAITSHVPPSVDRHRDTWSEHVKD